MVYIQQYHPFSHATSMGEENVREAHENENTSLFSYPTLSPRALYAPPSLTFVEEEMGLFINFYFAIRLTNKKQYYYRN